MNSKDRRKAAQKRRKQKERKSRLTWAGIIIVGLIVGGYFVYTVFRPAEGEAEAIAGSDHVEQGQPVTMNSNPPTSGDHYASPMPAGFYDEHSPEVTDLPYPEGYLIHSLEHGYVVFWYNCDLVSEKECFLLKEDISVAMDNSSVSKLIAFPWPSLEVPIVMTSWGQKLAFETFGAEQAEEFIIVNRLKAPEAGAP